jgi:sugar-specific transcriptional regulator TrmB
VSIAAVRYGTTTSSSAADRSEEPASALSDLEYQLLRFGLTPLQARIYLWLLLSGPTNASEVIRGLGVHRADVYRVLRGLAAKGIVEINMANPTVYAAVAPAKSVQALLREQENKISELHSLSGTLVDAIDKRVSEFSKSRRDSNPTGPTLHSSFRLKFGAQVIETWREMLRGAKEEVMRVWSRFGITYHFEEGLLEEYVECAKRGVKIRALTDVGDDTARFVRKYSGPIEFRHTNIGATALRYTVVDRKEVFVSTTLVPIRTSDFTALWTDNGALVRGFIMDFEEAWEKSKPLSIRLSQLSRNCRRKKKAYSPNGCRWYSATTIQHLSNRGIPHRSCA